MSDLLKAAIIGYGYMGEIRKRVIEQNQSLELAGILDNSASVRDRIKGYRIYSSFEELINDNVDIIFV